MVTTSGPEAKREDAPHVALFGAPALELADRVLPFAAERRFQLLAYLAGRGAWVTREQLVALFWPDHDAASARRNLRGVLHELRALRAIPPVAIDGDSVRWAPDSDKAAFDARLAARDFDAAARLVRGPFLDGLELRAPQPYVDWVCFEREMLWARWRDAVLHRLAELADAPEARLELAQRAHALDALNESIAEALVEAHLALARPAEAARVHRAFVERLQAQAGVTPSGRFASIAMFPALTDGARARAVRRASPHGDFIGRRTEMGDLVALVQGGRCRWVTVLGTGGVGKSSLARVAADALEPEFADGVLRVELRDLSSEAQIVARTAEACTLALDGQRDPFAQLCERLAGARALVVYDNFEHLAAARGVCERLLDACPRVQLVVTSRIRLGGRGEWIFPLDGLPVPDEDEVDPAVLRAFDAVALFEARARRVVPHFALEADPAGVRDLVRAVDGLPLALEFAAASVRLLAVREIRDQLGPALETLAAANDGTLPRDRSLRASFDHSWRLSSAAARAALARLTVFAGDFTHASAHQVADAPLPMLASLVDQSLVRAAGDDRFSLHPLVAQFAREHLDDEATLRARHATFFAQWLDERSDAADARAIDAGLPDVLAAWRHAIRIGAHALIQRMAAPLLQAYDRAGRWREGLDLFDDADAALAPATPAAAAARAEVARAIAMLRYRQGDLDLAEARAREALRLAISCRSVRGVDASLNLIGGALRQRGRWEEARVHFERALRHAQAGHNAALARRIANNIATVEMATGRPDRAIARCEALLADGDPAADPLAAAMTLIILGNARNATGERLRAQRRYEEGLALAERHRLVTVRPFFLQALGTCHREQGRSDVARDYYRRTLDGPREGCEPHVEASALLGLARIYIDGDELDAARGPLTEALAIAARMRSPAWQLAALARWGEYYARQGDRARAIELLSLAAHSHLIDANLRAEARDALVALGREPPPSRMPAGTDAEALARIVGTLLDAQRSEDEAPAVDAPRSRR
jgi:predicted ATPase